MLTTILIGVIVASLVVRVVAYRRRERLAVGVAGLVEVWRAEDAVTGVFVRPSPETSVKGWMQTFSGRRFYPLAPRAEDIELADVAHGLAMTCRYGGQSRHYYSVAEHCVIVSEVVERDALFAGLPIATVRAWALAALLHDSAEAYIGDMVRPLKHQPEMLEFRNAERAIEVEVCRRFSLGAPTGDRTAAIKTVDDRILVDEIHALMPDPSMYAPWLQGLEPLGITIVGWSPAQSERQFLARYRVLTGVA